MKVHDSWWLNDSVSFIDHRLYIVNLIIDYYAPFDWGFKLQHSAQHSIKFSQQACNINTRQTIIM